jgi:chromosome segregation ATPase
MSDQDRRIEYDKFAISRAIDQVKDPALRAFLEATVDVVTGLTGNARLGDIEDRDMLRAEVARLVDVVAAERKDRGVVVKYLEKQDKTLERLEAAAAQQRADFQKVAEVVDDLVVDVGGLKQGQSQIMTKITELDTRQRADEERLQIDEARIDAKRARIEALEDAERLRQAADALRDAEIARIAASLAARPTPEEAYATYEGVRKWGTEIAALADALARIEKELKRGNGH